MLNVIQRKNKTKQNILPIWMEISPIAQVALLHTEMNSGFRLVPKIGMKSARKNNILKSHHTVQPSCPITVRSRAGQGERAVFVVCFVFKCKPI